MGPGKRERRKIIDGNIPKGWGCLLGRATPRKNANILKPYSQVGGQIRQYLTIVHRDIIISSEMAVNIGA